MGGSCRELGSGLGEELRIEPRQAKLGTTIVNGLRCVGLIAKNSDSAARGGEMGVEAEAWRSVTYIFLVLWVNSARHFLFFLMYATPEYALEPPCLGGCSRAPDSTAAFTTGRPRSANAASTARAASSSLTKEPMCLRKRE